MHLTLQCSGQSALCKLWLVLFKNVLFKTPRFSAKRMSNLSVISLSLASTYRNGLQPTCGGFASSHTFPCKLVCQFGLEGTACGHAFFMWRRGDAASTRSSRSASLALGYFQVLLFSFFKTKFLGCFVLFSEGYDSCRPWPCPCRSGGHQAPVCFCKSCAIHQTLEIEQIDLAFCSKISEGHQQKCPKRTATQTPSAWQSACGFWYEPRAHDTEQLLGNL